MLSEMHKLMIAGAAVVFALLIGFLIGYLPQSSNLKTATVEKQELSEKLSEVERKLTDAEFRLKLSELRDQLTMLHLEVLKNNFGSAMPLSTTFFDNLMNLLPETKNAELLARLSHILNERDLVTTSLAKADPKTVAKIEEILLKLHETTRK